MTQIKTFTGSEYAFRIEELTSKMDREVNSFLSSGREFVSISTSTSTDPDGIKMVVVITLSYKEK